MLAGEAFDGVVCCIALMDVPGAAAAIRTSHRLLAVAGFRIERVEEPVADGAIGERLPEFRAVAAVLLVRGRKDSQRAWPS